MKKSKKEIECGTGTHYDEDTNSCVLDDTK